MTNLIGFREPETDLGLAQSTTTFGVTERQLASVRTEGDENHVASISDTHKTICREDNSSILGVVGANYKLLSNQEFFGAVEEAILDSVPSDMQEGVVAREFVSQSGRWSRREFVFPAYAQRLQNTSHETKVGLRVIASNSYDGSASARLLVGLIDFYCTNGMILGKNIRNLARRHSSRLTPAMFVPGIRKSIEESNEMLEEVEQMMQTPIQEQDVIGILDKQFSGVRSAALLARFHKEREERGDNVFALHSALTHYASHNDESYTVRGEYDPRQIESRENEVLKVVQSREFRELMPTS